MLAWTQVSFSRAVTVATDPKERMLQDEEEEEPSPAQIRRVASRSQAEEDCTEELFNFLHVRDHCMTHKLVNSLK
ncbi:hypothetical protein JEQ12_004970 [Ovis aries]|uniref:Ubiquinol-cytochrome C reductase hinge domain-containing protein n=1 Tax=Ovis aries TaxID=9940 RepID=A0A836A320_SHEEP|nr:hypothetical protein JEQ12_004970 [Ovis aries]